MKSDVGRGVIGVTIPGITGFICFCVLIILFANKTENTC